MTQRSLVLRDEKRNVHPDRWRFDPCYGELFIDDATGVVLTTPTALIIAGAPLTTGQLHNVTHDTGLATERVTATAGKLEVVVPGDYEVYAHGTLLSGNASVCKVEVFKNAVVVADAAASPGGSIRAELKMQATAAQESFAIPTSRLRGLVAGDTIDLRCTASVGNATFKQLRFGIKQVADADPVFEA